jgi:elongation factor Ts
MFPKGEYRNTAAFAKPRFLSDADVPADVVAKERAFVEDQTKNDPKMVGKPDAAIQSAVDGRLRKFLGEIVLLSQPYIREDKKTVGQLAKDQNGTISRFTRFEVGEGTPKQAAE